MLSDPARRRPNILVVLTDQQRWDCSGLHGNPLDLMPNFDRLARAGTHVRHSFTCQPLCVPARACLQTGRYATQVGTHINGCPLPGDARTLAHYFSAAGYRTGYIGKWHLGPPTERGAVAPAYRGGYQDWLAANILELVSDAYDCRLFDERGVEHSLPGYRVDAMTNAAVRYIRAPRLQPFYLFLSFLEPHQQNSRDDYPAPEDYAGRYAGRWTPSDLVALGGTTNNHLGGYYGMVKRLDEALGRLVEAIRQAGQAENTILLFTSDHGCHFRTRNAEYKRSCHESSIRVPTFFHGPGFMDGGDRPELVSLVDLPATLLDAAGLAIPAEMAGRSLLPRLRDPSAPWRDEIFIQVSESQNARALRTTRWKYGVTAPAADADKARNEPSWPIYDEEVLYDLERDPYELRNLVDRASLAELRGELRGRLLQRMAEAEEPPAQIRPAPGEQLAS